MLKEFDWVRPAVSLAAEVSHSTFQGWWWSRGVLAAASGTCRAWFAFCAPDLYRRVLVLPSRSADELVEDLSKPGSHIPQHARRLRIYDGPVPWRALPKLVKLLPNLDRLIIERRTDDMSRLRGDEKATDARYHPTHPRMTYGVLTAARITLALTQLNLYYHRFSSAADVLNLLASFPRLSTAKLDDCPIGPGRGSVITPSATDLRELRLAYCSTVEEIVCLADWWRWSHPVNSPSVAPYPGLHWDDYRRVCSVLESLCTITDTR